MTALPKALLVLGMHRSGTSATSGALERLGFALGGRLVPPAEDNPKGYFEHEAVVAQHEHFLDALGRHWADPRPFAPDVWDNGSACEVRRSIEEVVREDFTGCARWAVKDPRLSRLLPLWEPLWERWGALPHVLLVLRRPVQVACSLARRDGFQELLSDWLWLRHTLEAQSVVGQMPFACIDYAALLGSPGRSLGRALRDLGFPDDGLDDALFAGFVDPGMNHHVLGNSDRLSAVSRLADDVFDACIASPCGLAPSALAAFEARLAACWIMDGPLLEVGMRLAGQLISERAVLRRDAYIMKSAYAAQVQWSDEAVIELTRLRDKIEQLDAQLAEADRVEAAVRRDLAFSEAVARARESERDNLLVERDNLLVERDNLLVERDDLLVERDVLRVERDVLRVERDVLRVERDGLLVERIGLLVERDGLLVERDDLLVERDDLRVERDDLRVERDHLLVGNGQLSAERDALDRQLAQVLASRSWRWTAPIRMLAKRFGRRS